MRRCHKALLAAVVILSLSALIAPAQELFRFTYREGEQYRILSRVDQTVTVDGAFSHRADMLNRIAITVDEIDATRGRFSVVYQHSAESTGLYAVHQFDREYDSSFWRDERGRYDIEPHYFVPVVRDVPVFPDYPLSPGDSWSHVGSEVHDLREGYGIRDAFHFPIQVNYIYLGEREWNGDMWPTFSVRYNISHRPSRTYRAALYPVRISGFSDQIMYWDRDFGRAKAYEEQYEIVLSLSNGQTVQFAGTASAEVVESTPLDRQRVREEIAREIDELGIQDTTVAEDERGVTLSLENIQFPPDSVELVASEREKLRRIALILNRYPERDILITGHTALAGSEAGRQLLSERRAAAVGEFLLAMGVRERDRMMFRGVGATQPIADNRTEAGMRRNRRVEITILDN
ncbi:MAG: OmpA family protein [Spirochaetaceae bacterium]|nr:MAG: OmpA family protein [Spirochaetaceae bacterium]